MWKIWGHRVGCMDEANVGRYVSETWRPNFECRDLEVKTVDIGTKRLNLGHRCIITMRVSVDFRKGGD